MTPEVKRIAGQMLDVYWCNHPEDDPVLIWPGESLIPDDYEAVSIVPTEDYDALLEAARPIAGLADACDRLARTLQPYRDDENIMVRVGDIRALRAALSRATGGES